MRLLAVFIFIYSLTSEASKPPIVWGCSEGAQLLTAGLCDSSGNTFIDSANGVTATSAFTNDNRLLRSDGTGRGSQASVVSCDDVGNMSGAKTFDLSSLTADRAIYGDGSKALTSSATTSTQLAYLSAFLSNLTTAGDIFYYNGSGVTRLPVGSDNQILKVDTSLAGKINWENESAGGNSFQTINAPSGTDPVADSSTDTLNLTSTSGDLTITGDSSTDTVDFDVNWTNPLNDSTNECFGLNASCGTNGASAGNNTAIGNGAVAGNTSNGNSTSIGQNANCSGGNSVCIGYSATGDSSAANQVIIGASLSSTAASVVNIGSLNTCTGDVCVGTDVDGQGSHAISIGNNCDIEADTGGGVCIGNAGSVGDGGSAVGFGISIGDSATVGWGYGIAIGRSATTNYASVVIGRNASATAHNQLILGGNSQATKDIYIGEGVTDATSNPISINSTERTGTNVAGNAMSFTTRGTGTGLSGEFLFKGHGAGTSGTTAGTLVTLTTIGPSGNFIDGVTDNIQLKVQGHSTQTNPVMTVETSAGTDILNVANNGVITLLTIATAPATCNIGDYYIDTSGGVCFCTAANTWTNVSGVGNCT